jgi:hypothetical protein
MTNSAEVVCRMYNLAISVWVVGLAAFSRTCAAAAVPLPTTGWTITADSFQVGYEPAKALDGQNNTCWHSAYSSVATPYPHYLVVDMKRTQTVAGIDYLPRQDTFITNGNIGQYKVALSADGTTWGPAVATGTWDGTSAVKQVRLAIPATGQYIRLLALSEHRAGKPWANAAEITVYGMQTLLQTVQPGLLPLTSVLLSSRVAGPICFICRASSPGRGTHFRSVCAPAAYQSEHFFVCFFLLRMSDRHAHAVVAGRSIVVFCCRVALPLWCRIS